MYTRKKSSTVLKLEKILGGPITFGDRLNALRLGEEETLEVFAKKLGISKQHLSDIEKGRKAVSPERAAKFAKILGYSEISFVTHALQDQLDRAGLKFQVHIS